MAYSLSSIARAQRSKRRRGGPALPPLGSYDPSIYLQMQQNKRGASDAGDQYALGQAQAQDDFGIQSSRTKQSHDLSLADLATSRNRSLADLTTGHDRSVGDLATAATRAGQDHSNSLASLARRYGVLAGQQAQGDRRAHVESGGLLSQQAAIRARNQSIDQAPIDLAYSRFSQDNAQEANRVNQDFGTQTGRLGEDYNRNVARENLDTSQHQADLALTLSRNYGSGRRGQPLGSATLGLIQAKNNALGGNLDLTAVAHQQAAANGYTRRPARRKRALII